jgi:hypothetical protein
LKKAIDLFIFKQRNDGPGTVKYNMFLLFENGIVLIQDILDRAEQTIVLDDTNTQGGIHLTRDCADMDYEKSILLVDVMQKSKDREDHFIR